MGANYTRPGKFAEEGDTSASGGSPMRAARPSEPGPQDRTVRNIGLEPPPPPPLFDTGLGQAFFKMRTALGASVWDMARLVGTDPTVIANLEAGALEELPAWTELTRLVEAYGALTGTDTAPLLARLMKDYAMTGPAVTQPITAHLPPLAQGPQPAARVPEAEREIVPYDVAMRTATQRAGQAQRGGRASAVEDIDEAAADDTGEAVPARSRRSHVWLLAGLLGAAVAGVLVARMQPQILYAAAWPLPQTVRQPLVAGIDWLVVTLAPKRDGLVWIDAGNPAWRKTDKLPEAKP